MTGRRSTRIAAPSNGAGSPRSGISSVTSCSFASAATFSAAPPPQLDLFEPRDACHEYKVVVTDKPCPMAELVPCHEGRGSQEGLFAELKSENGLAYVPTNIWLGNRAYLWGGADRPQPHP